MNDPAVNEYSVTIVLMLCSNPLTLTALDLIDYLDRNREVIESESETSLPPSPMDVVTLRVPCASLDDARQVMCQELSDSNQPNTFVAVPFPGGWAMGFWERS